MSVRAIYLNIKLHQNHEDISKEKEKHQKHKDVSKEKKKEQA